MAALAAADVHATTVVAPTFSPAAGTYSSVKTVTISSTTSGASIRYTTNGSTPSSTVGTVYSAAVSVGATETLKAIAYKTGDTSSSVTSGTYTINLPVAATPTFSPVAATYTSAQSVTISSTTSGASIAYTLDGTTPTESGGSVIHGTLYSAKVSVGVTETLKAIAFKTGDTDSAVGSAAYTINLPVAATPTFSPVAATYTSAQSVTISSTTSGASIAYTVDGTTPTESGGSVTHGTLYSAAVSVSVTETLKAIAFKTGDTDSAVGSAAYTINLPVVAAPTFGPAAGTYTSAQSVTISSTTTGASIRYTTNGSTPSSTVGTVYSAAVSVGVTETLKAIAYKTGDTSSSVTSGIYTINLPVVAATPTFSPVAGTYTSVQPVTISSTTSGTSIAYTVDGTTPTESGGSVTHGTLYSAAVSVSVTETLKAIAFKTGDTDSAVGSAAYTINLPVAATPTFSPVAGTYTSVQPVTISSTTSGASIAYTVDGTTPTESGGSVTHGTLYSAAVSVGVTETLKAIAFKTGDTDSTVGSAAYTINLPVAATPTFSPVAGTYTSVQPVTISSTTSGASIAYTVDGTTPTESGGSVTHGTLYSAAVSVSVTETLKAIAFKTGDTDSAVGSAAYTINLPVAATPTFSPVAGTYTSVQPVTISSTTSGASIAYTVDGTTPTESGGSVTHGTLYSAAVSVGVTETLKAITFKTGDTDSAVGSAAYTINLPKPVITSATNATTQTGSAFNYQIIAVNGPTSFSATSLPNGLSVNTSTGVISGTLGIVGTNQATINATNSGGTGSATLTITVTLGAPIVTSVVTATGRAGSQFSYQITGSNNPTSFSAVGLPMGLSINTSTGLISGIPAVSGSFGITITVANAVGNGTATLNLSIQAAIPSISSAASAGGQAGTVFNYLITAINSPVSFGAAGLPLGLSVNSATGTIFGTPTVSGNFAVTISATNSVGTGTEILTLVVGPSIPVISSPGSATGQTAVPFSFQVTAINSPVSFGASGLPAGLGVNTSTGYISGTPTSNGSFYITLSASNAVGTGNANFELTINPSVPLITSAASESAQTGTPFIYQITATNVPTSFSASGLPAGLNVSASSGAISGTPTATGSFNVTINASNAAGVGTASLVITVTLGPPTITSTLNAAGQSSDSFSYQITASNSPTNYTANGLPAGLSLNSSTGLISGIPTVNGSFSVALSASNSAGTGTADLTISITPAIPIITSSLTTSGQPSAGFSYQITATNSPTSFGATGLPSGFSINSSTGLISGLPSATGSYSVTISATNGLGTGSAMLALTIDTPITNGMVLWLEADTGVQLTTQNGVTTAQWADQSGQGNSATQTNSNQFPSVLTNVINGHPAVHFNASTQSGFSLPNFLSSNTAGDVFVIVRSTLTPNENNNLWAFGPVPVNYPSWNGTSGTMSDSFLSTKNWQLGPDPVDLTVFNLYNASSGPGTWAARVNGGVLFSSATNTVSVPSGNTLQFGVQGFTGDVAEVIVYNRVLTDAERLIVGQYLQNKYQMPGIWVPQAPGSVSAAALSSTEVNVTWTDPAATDGVVYSIQRESGSSGFVTVGQVTNSQSFTDTGLTAGTSYTYQVFSQTYAGISPVSASSTVVVPSDVPDLPTSGMQLWLRADTGVQIESGGTISYWQDQSGNGNTATQLNPLVQPVVLTNVINGHPAVHFNASTQSGFSLPNFLSSNTAGDVFVIVRSTLTPNENNNLWAFGPVPVNYPSWNGTSGTMSDSFLSTKNWQLGPDPVDLTVFNLYNASSGPGTWAARVNGGVLFSSATNTVSVPSGNTLQFGVQGFTGDVAEVIVYNRVLTDAERLIVGQYLQNKYQMPGIWVPQAPGSVSAAALSSTEVNVTWTDPAATDGVVYSIQRESGSSGFVTVGQVTNSQSFTDTGLTAGTSYTYQVFSQTYAGISPVSASSTVVVPSDVPDLPTSGMQLWLRADTGVQIESGGTISYWQDQSGNGNTATQLNPLVQPVVLTNVINGHPAVHFNASTQSGFSLPNFLSSNTAGDVFVIVRSTFTPNNTNFLWTFGPSSTNYPNWNGTSGTMSDTFLSTKNWQLGPDPVDLTVFNLYNASSGPGTWAARVNGGVLFSSSANTVGVPSGNTLQFGVQGFTGDVAEVIVYNRVLTDAERLIVGQYFQNKYNIQNINTNFANSTLENIDNNLENINTPIGVVADILSSTQVYLTWQVMPNAAYVISRSVDGGAWTSIGSLQTPDSSGSFLDYSVPAGNVIKYQVQIQGSPSASEIAIIFMNPAGTDPEDGLTYAIDEALGIDPTIGNDATDFTLGPVVPPVPPTENPTIKTPPTVILLTPSEATLN